MKHAHDRMMFEAKELQKLVENSYEDLMTKVDNAIAESEDVFGKDATLLATYPNRAIVINENGKVFAVDYVVGHGHVKFGNKKELSVPTINQDNIAKKAVDSFFDGNSLAEGLKGLASSSFVKQPTPLEEVSTKLDILFSGGMLWRGFVKDNPSQMAQFAFDPKFGTPKIEVEAKFDQLYDGMTEDEELEANREEVVASLTKVSERLNKLFAKVRESYKAYKNNLPSDKTEDESAVLKHFESFSEDYIEDLERVFEFVSESVQDSESNCVACLAFVHDEVAKRVTELELGERLIRKVSTEFAQQ